MRLHVLAEARKNWDHPAQAKVYGADKLRNYAHDPDIYVSFTVIEKLGINPNSKYQTPIGIYTYPLAQVFDDMDKSHEISNVPFAGSQKFVWVCKSVVPVIELSTYDNLDNDIEKLTRYLEKNSDKYDDRPAEIINSAIINSRTSGNAAASQMWNITRKISRNPRHWNYILREVLGYQAISDKTGMGLIHPAEPIQAVFLSIKGFKIIDKVINNAPRLYHAARNIEKGRKTKNPSMVNYVNLRKMTEKVKMLNNKLIALNDYPNEYDSEDWESYVLKVIEFFDEFGAMALDRHEGLKDNISDAMPHIPTPEHMEELAVKAMDPVVKNFGARFDMIRLKSYINFRETLQKFDSKYTIDLSKLHDYVNKLNKYAKDIDTNNRFSDYNLN